MNRLITVALIATTALLGQLTYQQTADACGCFAPPDPSVPIVQAGERIAFAVEDGVVISHIQVQYSGAASEFGWLLPLPSLPELEVGTDELFTNLIATTQPRYRVTAEFEGNCEFGGAVGGGFGGASGSEGSQGDPSAPADEPSVVVIQDTVGPYDFAVLRADSKQPMLDWLLNNEYFIPAGTDSVVDAYIRPGAYFLALKLQSGNDVGDLQPVVVKYASDMPMIPIVLTSVAADPDMGVQVWVLGDSRAIPFNYFHTQINDVLLDWINFAQNYVDVITQAVDEADGHHSFVTEYAGSSDPMIDLMDPEWRFGDLDVLRTYTDQVQYLAYMRDNGFPQLNQSAPFFAPAYTSQALSILRRHIPYPAALEGDQWQILPNEYYTNAEYYLGQFRTDNPSLFAGLDFDSFDPNALTDELDERVVTPTKNAGQLFRDHPYMTRMFTTLSPNEMTKDPVFAWNPDLPEVSNQHEGRMIYHCGFYSADPNETPVTLITEQGHAVYIPGGPGESPWIAPDMPASLRIEILRLEGQPEVVTDNSDVIGALLSTGGCNAGGDTGPMWMFGALGIAFAIRRRRRG